MHEEYENKLMSERDRIKNLIRVLSHDLSNPLLIIENYIKRILKQNKDEKLLVYASKVETSVNAMKDISSSVRKMQAIEEGKYKLNIKPTLLNECIDYIVFLLEDSLISKQIEIVYDAQKNKDLLVYVDPIVFKNQVLANILSNSIKFSDPGQVIEILVHRNESTGQIELKISDNGVGMSEDIVTEIFMADKPTSRKGTGGESGTGYGMLIVKSFMDQFKGEINIKSTEKSEHCKDHGTIVTLSLSECETQELH
jgi:signal transduction histidine kinase